MTRLAARRRQPRIGVKLERRVAHLHLAEQHARREEVPGDARHHAGQSAGVAAQIDHHAIGVTELVDGGGDRRVDHRHPDVESDEADGATRAASSLRASDSHVQRRAGCRSSRLRPARRCARPRWRVRRRARRGPARVPSIPARRAAPDTRDATHRTSARARRRPARRTPGVDTAMPSISRTIWPGRSPARAAGDFGSTARDHRARRRDAHVHRRSTPRRAAPRRRWVGRAGRSAIASTGASMSPITRRTPSGESAASAFGQQFSSTASQSRPPKVGS